MTKVMNNLIKVFLIALAIACLGLVSVPSRAFVQTDEQLSNVPETNGQATDVTYVESETYDYDEETGEVTYSGSDEYATTDAPKVVEHEYIEPEEDINGVQADIAHELDMNDPVKIDSTQPVAVVLHDESSGNTTNRSATQEAPVEKEEGGNHFVGMAVAAGVLGLICFGVMIAMKKGPTPPPPVPKKGK